MDEAIKADPATIHPGDRTVHGRAFASLMEATAEPVDWATAVSLEGRCARFPAI